MYHVNLMITHEIVTKNHTTNLDLLVKLHRGQVRDYQLILWTYYACI